MWHHLEVLGIVFILLFTIPSCLLATRATPHSHWWAMVPFACIALHTVSLYMQGVAALLSVIVILGVGAILCGLTVSVCWWANRLGMPLKRPGPNEPIFIPLPK